MHHQPPSLPAPKWSVKNLNIFNLLKKSKMARLVKTLLLGVLLLDRMILESSHLSFSSTGKRPKKSTPLLTVTPSRRYRLHINGLLPPVLVSE